jgi:hypothetical protein
MMGSHVLRCGAALKKNAGENSLSWQAHRTQRQTAYLALGERHARVDTAHNQGPKQPSPGNWQRGHEMGQAPANEELHPTECRRE